LSSFEAIESFLATNTTADIPADTYEQLTSLADLYVHWKQLDFDHTQHWAVDSTWLADLPFNTSLTLFIHQVHSVHAVLVELWEQISDYRRRSIAAIGAYKAITHLPEFQSAVFQEIDQYLQTVSIQDGRLAQWQALQERFNHVVELTTNTPDNEVPPVLVEIVQEAKNTTSPLLPLYEMALKQYPPLWQYWLRHNAQRLFTRMGRRGAS